MSAHQANFHAAGQNLGPVDVQSLGTGFGGTCAVQLIDRRTGSPLRVNGSAVVVFTSTPDKAAAELLAGRDPANWEARVEGFAADVSAATASAAPVRKGTPA